MTTSVSVAEFITVRFQPSRLSRDKRRAAVSVAEFITVRFQPVMAYILYKAKKAFQ